MSMNIIASILLATASVVTQKFENIASDQYIVKEIPVTNGVYNISVAEATEASAATVGSTLANSIAEKTTTNQVEWIATNVVNREYIEGLGIKAGLTTNDVRAIVSDKRDLTNNVSVATSAIYGQWSTNNLPSAVTWDAQPFIADDGLWTWHYDDGGEGGYSQGGMGENDNDTFQTFGYGEGFTSTRTAIPVATSNDTFTTYGFVTNAIANATPDLSDFVTTTSKTRNVAGEIGKSIDWGTVGTLARVYGVDYAINAKNADTASSVDRAKSIGIVNVSTGVYKTFGFAAESGSDDTIVLTSGTSLESVKTNAYINDVETRAMAIAYPVFGNEVNLSEGGTTQYTLEKDDVDFWMYTISTRSNVQLWFENKYYDCCNFYKSLGQPYSIIEGLLYRNGDTYTYTNTIEGVSYVATFTKTGITYNQNIADRAMHDGSGNNITNTYATKSALSNYVAYASVTGIVESAAITNMGAAAYADAKDELTKQIVYTWEQFLDGSNVVFSITNYISGSYNLDAAKLRIMEMTNGVYREVYNSRDEINLHVNYFKTNDFRIATNSVITTVNTAIAGKADKAWGNYTSAGTDIASIGYSNTVYMTAPNTVFAGGMEYERVAVGEGSICVLTTKGAPTYTAGDEGTFKFQSDGGTNYFGFAKTDSYVIGCDTDGIGVTNNLVTLTYNVTMAPYKPCIWYLPTLDGYSTNTWEQLSLPDGTAISGATHVVSWDPNPDPGTEVCWINCTEAKGFFRATIEVTGTAKFITNMPADLMAGIICTNTATHVNGVIRPTYNGSTVNWTWSAQ